MQSDANAARAINEDWGSELDSRQVGRWSRAVGEQAAIQEQRDLAAMEGGIHPPAPANAPELLVIEVDGGRWQSRQKNPETQNRWRESKVCTVIKYAPGDGQEREAEPLVSSCVASTADAQQFGRLCRLEAERRGLRDAEQVLAIADGGNWIDPLLEREFRGYVRILDYYHAQEHLWEVAKAIHGPEGQAMEHYAQKLIGWLWNGHTRKLIAELRRQSTILGPPRRNDSADHPRQVLAGNVGYFMAHESQMDYPAYRSRGWPIGSGAVEAGVKQFNKRLKGTEQFWNEETLEPIMALRGLWLSQDQRWQRHWNTRPAYQRAA